MLVQEVLATVKLSLIRIGTKCEVSLAVLNCGSNFLGRHLPVIHLAGPDAEGSTWRGSNGPIWIIVVDQLFCQMSVGAVVEFPWLSIRIVVPKVKGSKALKIQRPAPMIAFGHVVAC